MAVTAPSAVVLAHAMWGLHGLLLLKYLVIKIYKFLWVGRCGEEHAGDVLCTTVIIHIKRGASPTKVLFLVHSRLPPEHKVVALASGASLEHQQPKLFLLGQYTLFYTLHFSGGDMVNIHTNSAGHSSGTL